MAKVRRRGGIKKRGPNSWLVSFHKHVDANGKRIDFSATVRGTRDEAQQFLHKKLQEFDLGILGDAATMTMKEFFDSWLETCSKLRNTPRTVYGHKSIFDRYFRRTIGFRKLDKLKPLEIQRVYAGMVAQGLSPQTIKQAHAVLRSSLNQAIRWRMIAQNPAQYVETPRVQRVERTVLTAPQAKTFIEKCDQMPYGLVFEFALLTGMRPEEFLATQWKDINFERQTVQVRRALVRHNRSWSFDEPKTPRSRRTIVLPAGLIHKLVIHKQKQTFAKLKAMNEWEDHDLVFCATFGTPLSIPNITYRYYRPILEAAGLPRIRLYDLRHTHATLLLTAEEHPKVVSERLGHSTIVLTMDTYSHVLPTMQRAATDRLEKLIFG
jgi:integrase